MLLTFFIGLIGMLISSFIVLITLSAISSYKNKNRINIQVEVQRIFYASLDEDLGVRSLTIDDLTKYLKKRGYGDKYIRKYLPYILISLLDNGVIVVNGVDKLGQDEYILTKLGVRVHEIWFQRVV